MSASLNSTITPVHVADLLVGDDEWMPLYVHVIDHPEGRVLVDTGLTSLHPLVADMDPRILDRSSELLRPDNIDIVVNTHLHYDHCGGNHLYPQTPIYVQRQEFLDATTDPAYTIREWVLAEGLDYHLLNGEHQLLPGIRLIPGPGHTPGSQFVVVETDNGPEVVAGDLAITSQDLDQPISPGQVLVRGLDPNRAWLAHQTEPWQTDPTAGVRS